MVQPDSSVALLKQGFGSRDHFLDHFLGQIGSGSIDRVVFSAIFSDLRCRFVYSSVVLFLMFFF